MDIRPLSTPKPHAATGLTAGYSQLEDAAPRLFWLAVSMPALFVLVESLELVAQPDLATVYREPLVRLTTLTAVLISLGVCALARWKLVLSSTLLKVGLVFEIAVAFAMSLVETAVPMAADRPVIGLSAVGPWVVLVGVLVPNPPIWTLVASLAAASTWPLAYAINQYQHQFVAPPWGRLVVWPGINFAMAVVAYVVRRRIYGITAAAQAAQECGSYRLIKPIGEGGMGEVWKADHQMLARKAAIKLVRPTAGVSARQVELAVRRFRREADAIAGLQSPHTIYLYDFGISRDGQFYYVMELLDGISLQTLVTAFGPQPVGRVRSILTQICDSLEEAHEQGIVHRDLKPSNVMLCKVALTHDFVKVLDFGLAKCAACEDGTQLTQEGTAAGTPGYIAPEVALGETIVDGRADVYGLGCVAYFLLTGALVFPEANAMSMALKHVQATPAPPSTRTELPIPAELDRIVLRCLEKKPGDRPSISEVARLLDICDFPVWTPVDAAEWWRQHLPSTSSLRSISESAPRAALVVERG